MRAMLRYHARGFRLVAASNTRLDQHHTNRDSYIRRQPPGLRVVRVDGERRRAGSHLEPGLSPGWRDHAGTIADTSPGLGA